MKISIKIDVTRIPKEKIVERRYTNKAGHEVAVKELELEIVPSKETKLIKDGDTWELHKTHFVAVKQSKEERANKEKGIIIGDGFQFLDKKVGSENENQDVEYPENTLEESPF
jgi:hypothetical protein